MFNSFINFFKPNKAQAGETLSYVEIPSRQTALYSIFWIHGLGADGHDVDFIAPELELKKHAHIRFISPNAPVREMMSSGERRVTMRSWYDISEIVLNARADLKGIDQSAMAINQLIGQEIAAGIASENILLMGISQGGCIALHTGLCYPKRLGGIVALSTYLSTADVLSKKASAANADIPIFMGHGTEDTSVAIESGKAAFNILQKRDYPIQWHEYPIGHRTCREEMQDVSRFINQIFC
jgi:phospholipase/carboxylesterase